MTLSEALQTKESRQRWELQFGARPDNGGTRFRVWSPRAQSVSVRLVGGVADDAAAAVQTVPMERRDGDVFEVLVPGVGVGADYFYLIDGDKERPDPVSRWQPAGVHRPSRVVDPDGFAWTDHGWRGVPLRDLVIYELHIGTFTPAGTFAAAIEKLPYLRELGVTAIELMPVAEFPGGRNWGYDGTYLYAPQSSYGGPEGLKQLIDACHREGLAFILDVVYNHLGPEGNYLGDFAPIFNHNYRTPWGDALNFDGPESEGVRRFFVDSALYWLTEYHIDGLRLDAVHRIIDIGPRHLLAELASRFRQQARALGREAWTIAESDLNDVRMIDPEGQCGYGLDAQWSDDFHHALHAIVTEIERGYFQDFGRVADLAKAIAEGFVYSGQHSAFRRKRHGNSAATRPGEQFVICAQNHDQIANGYWGERLASLVSLEQQKLCAAVLLCGAPNVPLLFMGQEWGETAPFRYFTSHTDEALARAVREGRREEYAAFVTTAEADDLTPATDEFADPQAPETFAQSKLDWSRLSEAPHRHVLSYYRDLLALRRKHPSLSNCDKERTRVAFSEERRWLVVERSDEKGRRVLLVCNLSAETQAEVPVSLVGGGAKWRRVLWSGAEEYGGGAELSPPAATLEDRGQSSTIRLSGWSVALYELFEGTA